jgi:hypothetical protein
MRQDLLDRGSVLPYPEQRMYQKSRFFCVLLLPVLKLPAHERQLYDR